MRRIVRAPLPGAVAGKLENAQSQMEAESQTAVFQAEAAWKPVRRAAWFRDVLTTLESMAGPRKRCMYCGDSEATDVEHFWPKANYPERMFRWSNMLLCCNGCGRRKGNRFPLDSTGDPLLIDPTAVDPWAHLDYDPQTSLLAPRYSAAGAADPLAVATLQVLKLSELEPLSKQLRRYFLRWSKAIEALRVIPAEEEQITASTPDDDDFGLSGWIFRGTGAQVEPFKSFREGYPDHWSICAKLHE